MQVLYCTITLLLSAVQQDLGEYVLFKMDNRAWTRKGRLGTNVGRGRTSTPGTETTEESHQHASTRTGVGTYAYALSCVGTADMTAVATLPKYNKGSAGILSWTITCSLSIVYAQTEYDRNYIILTHAPFGNINMFILVLCM